MLIYLGALNFIFIHYGFQVLFYFLLFNVDVEFSSGFNLFRLKFIR